MTIQVSWYDESAAILRVDFGKGWNWQDFGDAYDRLRSAVLSKAPQRVDVILHNDAPELVIPLGNPWPLIRQLAAQIPPNAGIQVFVGANRTVHLLHDMQTYIIPDVAARTRFADTVAEAAAEILRDREHRLTSAQE